MGIRDKAAAAPLKVAKSTGGAYSTKRDGVYI